MICHTVLWPSMPKEQRELTGGEERMAQPNTRRQHLLFCRLRHRIDHTLRNVGISKEYFLRPFF